MLTTVAVATMLAGCDRIKGLIGGAPKGQVVATVDGEEITARDLRAEMQGFSSADPKIMKAAQQQAVQQLIMRTVIAQKAEEMKLDKTPEFTMQVRRGEQGVLAQLYQRKIASAVAKPTRADAETYVESHPGSFANRRIMVVDQVIAPPNKIPPARYEPLNTLEEVKGLLDSSSVPYQDNVTVMDTLSVDPRLIAEIDKLPPGGVFVMPQRGVLVFSRISATRTAPLRGDMAVQYATNLLQQQRSQQTVSKQVEILRKGVESKIAYNDAYKPAPPAAAKAVAPPAK